MDQADQQGIVVIDECPAVGLQTLGILDKKSRVICNLFLFRLS